MPIEELGIITAEVPDEPGVCSTPTQLEYADSN